MVENEVVIDVKDVTKQFKIFMDRGKTAKERVLFSSRRKYEYRKVLKGISFQVKKGEAVGLIGHNGCGKSTTLKLLTKIIYPDSGSIDIKGRVSSLIELGAGFHPDMSGRENIYINASIFGLGKKEIEAKIDDIIAFSELEEFIDNPVRTYSSGMYMRLAFSVAINVNADVILIDEILAVGDANFQSKCFNKLREIKDQGATIVIVSHSLGQIEQICERTIWIHEGLIRMEGEPREVHPKYLDFMGEKRAEIADKEKERQAKKVLQEMEERRKKEEREAKRREEEEAPGIKKESVEAFVNYIYINAKGSKAFQETLDYWFERWEKNTFNGQAVLTRMFSRTNYGEEICDDEQFIELIYKIIFGRKPEEGGRIYWLDCMRKGLSRQEVLHSMVCTDEYQELCDKALVPLGIFDVETEELPENCEPEKESFLKEAYSIYPSASGKGRADRRAYVVSATVFDEKGKEKNVFSTGSDIKIELDLKVRSFIKDAVVGIEFVRNDGVSCYGTNTRIDRLAPYNLEKDTKVTLDLKHVNLIEGKYYLDVTLEEGYGDVLDFAKKICELEFFSSITDVGISRIDHEWKVEG
ncbi:MAG: Wzt carbohydrate-binding domain-containing protein [Lachnospiraceae bacterium]|nr:Wzt carbohydrate-binding domain-containing protein [Lachnospiraceae bacterium]